MIFTKISNGYKASKMIIINEKDLIKHLKEVLKSKYPQINWRKMACNLGVIYRSLFKHRL